MNMVDIVNKTDPDEEPTKELFEKEKLRLQTIDRYVMDYVKVYGAMNLLELEKTLEFSWPLRDELLVYRSSLLITKELLESCEYHLFDIPYEKGNPYWVLKPINFKIFT